VLGGLLVQFRVTERALCPPVEVDEQLLAAALEVRHQRAPAAATRKLGERRLRAHGW
jgi:hypothetical protein